MFNLQDAYYAANVLGITFNEFPNYYNNEYGLKKFEEFLKFKRNL